eukprot:scpid46323/ scgid4896/ Peroxisomal multifunctional enzyme type 2; 17-beta-hydroxysteroid dehydrogenase 4; D-bifunctional protein; Multifunctional protein 2; (3R)-hydroxyacyl-CoA dehydrogenase; Enoyl-CoA hydratase 2; 3-alpha,7-alpha,12-alpha-trihydroxy-5-beta-cholest-24-enoyl-CoA hydratase
MSGEIRFDGRVALVTGAGQGLGRAYAILLASRGASVVVNDLGGGAQGGDGGSSRPADIVVEAIRAAGGKAVANYDSVEEGEKLVKTALDAFGRIDIVVNNAGILRDKSFLRITKEDFDIIQRVHLRGSFLVTQAAFPHMKKNGFGRIIMTASASGMYGSYGQTNYAAAKMGLIGLSNTLALEGVKNNILCNTIAPMAGSRLTKTIWPQHLVDLIKPEYVAPLVALLCSEESDVTGGLFEVGAGWVAQVRWERSKGAVAWSKTVPCSPESVRDNWEKITSFEDADHPTSSRDTFNYVMAAVEGADEEESSSGAAAGDSGEDEGVNVDKALGWRPAASEYEYDSKEAILYALGVGCTVSDKDTSHLKFLYEGHDDFCCLPTFVIIPAQVCSAGLLRSSQLASLTGMITEGIPGFKFDFSKLLHGEQHIEMHRPMPTSGKLRCQSRIRDLIDKGKGAVIVQDVECFGEDDQLVATAQFVTFIVGAGGFGGPRSSAHQKPTADPPKRSPDAVVTEKTSESQAALYRLSGDLNPLHIDPDFAAMGGFSTPILHGLCSMGYAARHVLRQYCDDDVTKFKALKVRFVKPVLPGQTLKTEMWKDGSRVYFRCSVVESGSVVLSGAYVDLAASSSATSRL